MVFWENCKFTKNAIRTFWCEIQKDVNSKISSRALHTQIITLCADKWLTINYPFEKTVCIAACASSMGK